MPDHERHIDDRNAERPAGETRWWRYRYRATCSCGWLGVARRSHARAAREHAQHVRSRPDEGQGAPRPVTPPNELPDALRGD